MITLDEFKEDIVKRRFSYPERYTRMLEGINKLYSEKELKGFYPKNLFNKKEDQFFFFYEDIFVVVEKASESDLIYRELKKDLADKVFITDRYPQQMHTLMMKIGEEEFVFNNKEDSNEDWAVEYTSYLYELYKLF